MFRARLSGKNLRFPQQQGGEDLDLLSKFFIICLVIPTNPTVLRWSVDLKYLFDFRLTPPIFPQSDTSCSYIALNRSLKFLLLLKEEPSLARRLYLGIKPSIT